MNTEKLLKKCTACLNKTFNYDNGLVYEHGRPVSITVTKVERDQVFVGVLVYNQMTFTDGYTSAPNSYCIGGEHFLNMTKQERSTTNCKSNQRKGNEMNDFITLKEMGELKMKGEPIINICGVEFYALQLERMMENGYKYLLRYRDIIQIEYVTNYEGHWLGRVIYKTQSNMTQRGRYYAATSAMVNRHLGFKLLNEEETK